MSHTLNQSAFAELFISSTPLLDVRAPVEFEQGSFPAASNIPLLDDKQRQAIGTLYKQQGRDAAIELGYKLIGPQQREQLLQKWQAYLEQNPNALLYCFRGGLRSQTVQRWLQDNGTSITLIEGGYKAMRRFLIDTIERQSQQDKFIIVAGKTGSGKTHLINQLAHSVDLEGCANHRGSAFGRRVQAQPTQINFENRVAIDFLKLLQLSTHKIFLEDESHAIGSVALPKALHASMKRSPVAVLEEPLESRVSTILDDYISCNYRDFQQQFPEQSQQLFSEFLLGSLERIRRRLGEENYQRVSAAMTRALAAQQHKDELSEHQHWIRILLQDYYDPMYSYQLSKKARSIVFRGNRAEFLDWSSHLIKTVPPEQ